MLVPLLSSLIQVLLIAALPGVIYLVGRAKSRGNNSQSSRQSGGFLTYIGLFRPKAKAMGYATLLVAVITIVMLLVLSLPGVREVASAPNTVPGRIRTLGLSAESVLTLALYALVQTALSEEILFRGFLAKRMIARLGFHGGNVLQALLFGSMHLLLFAGPAGQAFSVVKGGTVVALTGLIGWSLGYLNERVGNGSIVPSWYTHGLTNLVAYSVLAFG